MSPSTTNLPDDVSSPGPLQFGRPRPDRDHPDRPAAFGVALRGVAIRGGEVALVRITRPDAAPYFDLPGGGVDPGEAADAAVVREFGEETGLIVRPLRLIARADQFLIKNDGASANNRSQIFEVEVTGEDPALKIEYDHALVWMAAERALATVRHDSHAWAIAAWLRLAR